MPVLREVITRFKFETDEQAARKVDQRVNKMKRGISGIGKVLGIGLGAAGAKALFSFGQTGERAEHVLRNLVGVDFKPLEQSMIKIRNELNLLQEGAGNVFAPRDFNIAAAGFFRTFKQGRKEIELFDKIFKSAAIQSGNTGENVAQLVQQLTQAVSGGDFSALLKLPGIDQSFVKRIEDINEIFNLGEIGGQAVIKRRMQALSDVLTKTNREQLNSIKSIPPQLLKMQAAEKKLQTGTEDLAVTFNKALIPAMEKLNKVLDKFVSTSDTIEKKGFLGMLQGLVGSAGPEKREKRIEELRSGKRKSGLIGEISEAQKRGPLPGGEKSPIFKVDIHINGAGDPELVGTIVEKKLNALVNGARQNVIPTEDR